MYEVLINDKLLTGHSFPVTQAKLLMKVSKAGTFTFTIASKHPLYNAIPLMTSTVSISQDGEIIWKGFVKGKTKDFLNNETYTCEGILSYLNDTVVPYSVYPSHISVADVFRAVLNVHNAAAETHKQFTLGEIAEEFEDTNISGMVSKMESPMTLIQRLVENYGGFVALRYASTATYIDWISEQSNPNQHECSQEIVFGRNMLDLSVQLNDDLYSVLYPLGERLNTQPAALDERLTIKSVNNNILYIENSFLISQIGRIAKVKIWAECTDAAELKAIAEKDLREQLGQPFVLTVTAYDLHDSGASFEQFRFLDKVNVVSLPNGIAGQYTLTELHLDLIHPAQNQIVLGTDKNKTLSSKVGT